MEQGKKACFVGLLLAMLTASIVNLTQLVLSFPCRALISSRYWRIPWFFIIMELLTRKLPVKLERCSVFWSRLGWMLKQNIPFYTHIRNNSYSIRAKGKRMSVDHLFRRLKPGEVMQCSKARLIGACSVYLSGLRLREGD
jgi:hypothetical protein